MYVFHSMLLFYSLTFSFRSHKQLVWEKLVVVDLTQGSGTTGEAALKLRARYIGNDIDPEMAEVCNSRLSKYKEWQEKPTCFYIEEWKKQVNWNIFSKVRPSRVGVVDEENEGMFYFC